MHTRHRQEAEFGLVALGTTSQYSHEDGSSACTSIAIVAAVELLRRRAINGPTLGLESNPSARKCQQLIDDDIVARGVEAYKSILRQRRSKDVAMQHCAFDECWQDLRGNFDVHTGILSSVESTGSIFGTIDEQARATADRFERMISSCEGSAFVITKPPETIAILVGASSSVVSPSFLFDSHARPGLFDQAHLLQFDSIADMCNELSRRLPYTDVKEFGNEQNATINQWEANGLRLNADVSALRETGTDMFCDPKSFDLGSLSGSWISTFDDCEVEISADTRGRIHIDGDDLPQFRITIVEGYHYSCDGGQRHPLPCDEQSRASKAFVALEDCKGTVHYTLCDLLKTADGKISEATWKANDFWLPPHIMQWERWTVCISRDDESETSAVVDSMRSNDAHGATTRKALASAAGCDVLAPEGLSSRCSSSQSNPHTAGSRMLNCFRKCFNLPRTPTSSTSPADDASMAEGDRDGQQTADPTWSRPVNTTGTAEVSRKLNLDVQLEHRSISTCVTKDTPLPPCGSVQLRQDNRPANQPGSTVFATVNSGDENSEQDKSHSADSAPQRQPSATCEEAISCDTKQERVDTGCPAHQALSAPDQDSFETRTGTADSAPTSTISREDSFHTAASCDMVGVSRQASGSRRQSAALRQHALLASVNELDDLCCSITKELMADPVIAADGHCYEREMISRHIQVQLEEMRLANTPRDVECERRDDECCQGSARRRFISSPTTNDELRHTLLTPVHNLVSIIESWIENGRIGEAAASEWRARREEVCSNRRAQMEARAAEPPLGALLGAGRIQGWLACQDVGGITLPRLQRYLVLVMDRLLMYNSDSTPEASFDLTHSTRVVMEGEWLVVSTPADVEGEIGHVLRLTIDTEKDPQADLSQWLQLIQDAISHQPPPYQASAMHVRIFGVPEEGPTGFTGLAVAVCAAADLDCAASISPICAIDGCHENAQVHCSRCGRMVCKSCGDYSVFSFQETVAGRRRNFKVPRRFRMCCECIEDAIGRIEENTVSQMEVKACAMLTSKLDAFEERLCREGIARAREHLKYSFEQREARAAELHAMKIRRMQRRLEREEAAVQALVSDPIIAASRLNELQLQRDALNEQRQMEVDEEALLRLTAEISAFDAQLEEADRHLQRLVEQSSADPSPQQASGQHDEEASQESSIEDDELEEFVPARELSETDVTSRGDGPSCLLLGLCLPSERGLERQARIRNQIRLAVAEDRVAHDEDAARKADIRASELDDIRGRLRQVIAQAGQAQEVARMAEQELRERERRDEHERRRQAAAEEQRRLQREQEEQEREQRAERERRRREAAERQLAADQEVERYLQERGAIRGDFRMCRQCRSGPYENKACRDLQLHNNEDGGNLNQCKNCQWFSSDWHDWLEWDGTFGPH